MITMENLTGEERRHIGELVKTPPHHNLGISQRCQAFKIGLSPARITQI
jgi:hypothetical protein